jgi:hypothetical protein
MVKRSLTGGIAIRDGATPPTTPDNQMTAMAALICERDARSRRCKAPRKSGSDGMRDRPPPIEPHLPGESASFDQRRVVPRSLSASGPANIVT